MMKKFKKYVMILCVLILPIQYTLAQDSIAKKTYKLSDFNKLEITGNFKVNVIHSDLNLIKVDEFGKDVDLDNLVFEYSNGLLSIKYKGSFVDDIPLELSIFYSGKITNVEIKRGCQFRIDYGFVSQWEKLYFHAVSGGKILAKNMVSNKVVAEISQGGSIRLEGTTSDFTAKVTMGGTIGANQLKAKNVEAKVSMGGDINCYAAESIKAKVSTGGTISYKGQPEKTQEKTTLGGTINRL